MPEQHAQLTALMRKWEDQSREISELGVVDQGKFNANITLKDPSRRLRFQKHRQLNPARKKGLMLWLEKAVKHGVVSKVRLHDQQPGSGAKKGSRISCGI
jgi:hypothetical protein